MNYLCLLQDVLNHYKDEEINKIFGYDGDESELRSGLKNLKINLAHYGSGSEWDRYLSKDRFDYSNKIISEPTEGLEFTKKHHEVDFMYKCWHFVDWYSIISSMIIEYPNVYADVSYTTHKEKYLTLFGRKYGESQNQR